jgi:hypothetical protein
VCSPSRSAGSEAARLRFPPPRLLD